MMGPIYWNPQSPTHLKKCSEFISNSCTDEASLGCCGVLPCSYCLEFHPYGEPVEYGLATFTGSSWSGTIAGASFSAFWDRGLYGDGECEFVVEIDGEEVYRESCYMGQQSCRDSSDEAEATIGYKSGTLIWIKREHRPLEYVEDFDTYCMEHFCDSCECSCKTLCLTIYDPDGTQTDRGELNDVAYACDPPKWEGRVGYFDLSLALERDLYGRCIIVGTVDGEEQEPVLAPGCTGLAGEIELYDGTRIVFVCKICDCGEVVPFPCECRTDGDIWEATLVTSNSPCDIANPAISKSDPEPLIPVEKRAWNQGDCIFGTPFVYRITAFPPDCVDPNISHFVVYVQKNTTTDTPFIDNSQVQQYEWYAVVYDDVTFDIIGISYEYATCCKNETPTDPATSHLIWVKWFNLPFGGGTSYDVKMTNLNAVAAYGDCT